MTLQVDNCAFENTKKSLWDEESFGAFGEHLVHVCPVCKVLIIIVPLHSLASFPDRK